MQTEGLASSYILMIVDSFSKWTEALPLYTQESREIVWKLYDEVICRFGCPESILTDKGQKFMSLLIKKLCKIFQITRGPWWPCNAHLSNIALWEPDLELIKENILIKVKMIILTSKTM